MRLELHPRQSQVLTSTANEILYGGAAGGGKSHLMRILAIIVAWQVPGAQVYLFRRESVDLVKNHLYGPTGFLALLFELIDTGYCRWNGQDKKFLFWNGSVIWLCHCQYEKDVYSYQGAEITLLLIDELTHFTKTIYTFLRGRLRMPDTDAIPEEWRSRLPMILAGTNPGGIGHNWVKADWPDKAPPGKVWRTDDHDGGMLRQFIKALLTDNPSIKDPEDYAKRLLGLSSKELVRAMLNGDWDIVAGGMFDDIWRRDIHVLPPFEIPRSWRIARAFDWGQSKPFSVGWWAVSDGTPAIIDGRQRTLPPRSLVRVGEWYGWNGKPDEGLRMTSEDVADGIKKRERDMFPGRTVMPGPADSSIYDDDHTGRSIADAMAKRGVRWARANKRPGSRKQGWTAIRSMLQEAAKDHPEERGLWVTSECLQFLRTIPVAPRDAKDPDDVDTRSEDHVADETRYMVLDDRGPAQAGTWFGR